MFINVKCKRDPHLLCHALALDVYDLPGDQALCPNSLADFADHLWLCSEVS